MSDTIKATPEVTIYTDGACQGNPGRGGWGALLRSRTDANSDWQERELCGGIAHTTNNRMELQAVISALTALKTRCTVILYTDSRYVQQGISTWIHQWKRNGWRTSQKQAVKNEDLWRQLDQAVTLHQIDWRWVKGHAGDPGNERADALANQGLRQAS